MSFREWLARFYGGSNKIKMAELLKSTKLIDLPSEHQTNLKELHRRINIIRNLYGRPMIVTSGYRTIEDHKRIYVGRDKIPMGSKHLSGQAVDIYDPRKELQSWCLGNEAELERVGLWCENFLATENWVHFQTVPPKSGRRFFYP